MGLWVSTIMLGVQWLFLGLAHRHIGRVARTNAFEVIFRVMTDDDDVDDIDPFVVGAQKRLGILCTPSAG